MLRRAMFALGSCWLVTACAWAQSVKVNWKTNAPISEYKTYAWKTGKQQGSGFYQQWVRQDIDLELAKKGLKKVSENQKPDVFVVYNMTTQELLDSTTTTDGFGWGGGPWGYWGGWGGWGDDGSGISTTEVEPRMMGILTVDLVDAKKHELVWRGQATEDSVSNSQKGDEKQVHKSIQKMFDHFPPKSGK